MAVETPYPTLAVSQFLSPAETRGLWLALYAAAFASGLPPREAVLVARRGVVGLSAEIVGNNEALPSWLREAAESGEEG